MPERNKGSEILKVRAIDSDLDARLKYTIIEPVIATTKAGFKLDPTNFDYKAVFDINGNSGAITLLRNLENSGLYSVTLTVRAEDLNAMDGTEQADSCEVILYVQSHKESGPIFLNEGWNNIDKKIHVKVNEELEIGQPIVTLEALDPDTQEQIYAFELDPQDGFGYFRLDEDKVVVGSRIDYETIEKTVFTLDVKAISPFSDSFSTAQLLIEIVNVNDNSPEFDKEAYKAAVLESVKAPERILVVKATDRDATRSDVDSELGYSMVKYSLAGPSASFFTINGNGEIQLASNHSLDREKQSLIKLQVVAEDSLGKPSNARKSFAKIAIEVLDVNDVKPKFLNRQDNGLISAVVSESAQQNTLVVNLEAYDADEGPSGEVRYEIVDDGDIRGLLQIEPTTGELKTAKFLTGRGRAEPYEIKVRATDNGSQIPKQRSLFTDQTVQIFIGDTFSNDGIPFFVSPDEEASVSENAPIGTKVYQIIAKDPDDPSTPSGLLRYRIQNDIEDAKYFKIEALSGMITTTQVLDRERKDKFNIIVEVSDQGDPPQASTRVLKINVLDVDDEDPKFLREMNAKPVELMVLEEQSSGVILGNVTAIDRDIGENGAIDYAIIDGNELEFFKLIVTNNTALVTTTKPIDRERHERFLLTVKCLKMSTKWQRSKSSFARDYNADDMSEIQVSIRVIDIDDHLVEFEQPNYMVAIRNTIPLNTLIFAVKAHDVDSSSPPIAYQVLNTTFVSQFSRKDSKMKDDLSTIFELNNRTGEILLAKSVSNYVDGHFVLLVRATNNRFNDALVNIFVVRDKSIMKFLFTRPPMEMAPQLAQFAAKLQDKINATDTTLSIFDAQVLSKPDQLYDFSSTSSCFMLFRNGNSLSLQETKKLMNTEEMKNRLRETYLEYSVDSVDLCSFGKEHKSQQVVMTSSGAWLVILAFLVLVASLISTFAACCLFKR